jgi:hypothetical protein
VMGPSAVSGVTVPECGKWLVARQSSSSTTPLEAPRSDVCSGRGSHAYTARYNNHLIGMTVGSGSAADDAGLILSVRVPRCTVSPRHPPLAFMKDVNVMP